jgi:hypothetical protein
VRRRRGGNMPSMIDRLDTAIARADQPPLDIPSSSPQVPVALEYQPPQPRASRRGDMVWGVVISVLVAKGVGWMIFGMLMMVTRVRDDEAGPVAVGAAFIILGVGIAGSLAWTRKQQAAPSQNQR